MKRPICTVEKQPIDQTLEEWIRDIAYSPNDECPLAMELYSKYEKEKTARFLLGKWFLIEAEQDSKSYVQRINSWRHDVINLLYSRGDQSLGEWWREKKRKGDEDGD